MMATPNSEGSGNPTCGPRHGATGRSALLAQPGCWCLSLIGLLMANWLGFSEDTPGFAQRAERNFQEARKKFQTGTNDAVTAWQFGRACFDWAEFAKNDDQRESIAVEGIAACRQSIARDPNSAPGHYYLSMNLG